VAGFVFSFLIIKKPDFDAEIPFIACDAFRRHGVLRLRLAVRFALR
jgi:hypothetical protein